jgi:hypothetical protein
MKKNVTALTTRLVQNQDGGQINEKYWPAAH